MDFLGLVKLNKGDKQAWRSGDLRIPDMPLLVQICLCLSNVEDFVLYSNEILLERISTNFN